MAELPTMQVRWPEKFGQRLVLINVADFNPAVHKLPGESEAVEIVATTTGESVAETTEPVEAIGRGRRRGVR